MDRLRDAAFALTEVVQGIADIDQLKRCDAVLSGYLGSAEQGNISSASCVR
jgi:pyridoxine kinase